MSPAAETTVRAFGTHQSKRQVAIAVAMLTTVENTAKAPKSVGVYKRVSNGTANNAKACPSTLAWKTCRKLLRKGEASLPHSRARMR